MDLIDKTIAGLFPGWHLKRQIARYHSAGIQRMYEAAKPGTQRRDQTRNRGSADAMMDAARGNMRNVARYLDENHDLAIGILDVLVNNIVGSGINIEPMVQTSGGKLHKKLNDDIRKLYKKWSRRPEITGELTMMETQRLICRSWLRDGEVLIQDLIGRRSGLNHATRIPYTLELIEADFLPFDLNRRRPLVVHGVEKNAWGQPIGYWLYKEHPGNMSSIALPVSTDLKYVSADRLRHIKFTRRIRQTRGVTVFHGILTRLEDIKDYEESERIAARVASAFTAVIKKETGFSPNAGTSAGSQRSLEMVPGMILDDLLPGESIETIDSKRPNSGLEPFRNGQMRAIAAGVGSSYSSISKDYSGTYSSQRQELVESQPSYRRLGSYFVNSVIEPTYRNFIEAAILSGELTVPRGIDQETLYEAAFRGDGMPWVDPKKEADADVVLIDNGIKSRRRIQRERGIDPDQEEQEIQQEREVLPLAQKQQTAPAGTADNESKEDGSEEEEEEERAANQN